MIALRLFVGLGRFFLLSAVGLMMGCASTQTESKLDTEAPQPLHHVVVVWLNDAGGPNAKQRYIEASRQLAHLPGVVSYQVGTPASIKNRRASKALEESYDVAVASVFESQQAFEAFLKNPEYVRIAQEVLRPLVERYQMYDFLAP